MKSLFFGVAISACIIVSFPSIFANLEYHNNSVFEIERNSDEDITAKIYRYNTKLNNEAINFLNELIRSLNPSKELGKVEALITMRDYINDNKNDDPFAVVDRGASQGIETAEGKNYKKSIAEYLDRIHSATAKTIWNLDFVAVGTGKTTGHIADLFITNNSPAFLSVKSELVYIKSKKKQFQSYVSYIPKNIVVPPNSTVSIPMAGYCANPHVPPVPLGENFPSPSEWIAIAGSPKGGFTIDGNPPMIPVPSNSPSDTQDPTQETIDIFITDQPALPSFNPDMINTIVEQPGFTKENDSDIDIVVTWPGVNDAIDGTFDPSVNPNIFAQVVTDGIIRIIDNVDDIQSSGDYLTPFSQDEEQEKEAIIQQTFWIFVAGARGEEYEEEDFANNVYTQFEETTGTNVTSLPLAQKEQLDGGVEAFWSAFKATGAKAKVFKINDQVKDGSQKVPPEKGKTNVPPPEKESICSLEIIEDPATYKLDYDFADTGTADANEQAKKIFKDSLDQVIKNLNKKPDTLVNIITPARSASAWSLWLTHAIGGFADGIAFSVDLKNPHKSAWTTEPLHTKSEGSHKVVLKHTLGPGCTSTLIGINMVRVRAKSKMLFTCGDIDALKVINFLGEIAIDIAIKKGKGTFKKLGKYLKSKTKDLAKGEVKDKVKEELKKISESMEGMSSEEAEQAMEELLKDIEDGNEEEEDDDFMESLISEMLVEGEEFKPDEFLEGQILDKVDSPIDWAPIKTNTYAMVRGALEISVDEITGKANGASGVRYNREELEDESDAVKGGGVACDEKVVSKITEGTITLETKGEASSFSGAGGSGIVDTGHGHAVAKLESFNGYFVLAICDCPTGTYLDTYIHSMGTVNDGSLTAHMNKIKAQTNKIKFENSMEDAMDSIREGKDLPADSGERAEEYKKWKSKLEKAALDVSKNILPCPK